MSERGKFNLKGELTILFVYELHTGGQITANNVNGVPLCTLMERDKGKTSSLVTLTLLLAQPAT